MQEQQAQYDVPDKERGRVRSTPEYPNSKSGEIFEVIGKQLEETTILLNILAEKVKPFSVQSGADVGQACAMDDCSLLVSKLSAVSNSIANRNCYLKQIIDEINY